jgi:hypothetical protein
VQLVLAEVDAAVAGGIGGEDREDDLLVVITGQGTNQQDVRVVVVPGGDVDATGFLLELVLLDFTTHYLSHFLFRFRVYLGS